MSKSRITEIIEQFLKEAGANIQEDRLTEYIVSEAHKGRKLSEILEDPNIKGKISDGHLAHVLERKEVMQAYEDKLKEAVK